MGIRTLHRQTAPAQATTDATASTPAVHVPPFSAAASSPRIPTDLATTLRKAATDVRHRLTRRDWLNRRDLRLWADQARGYLALLLSAVPRSRPMRTVTVFIATVGTANAPSDGSTFGRTAADLSGGSAPGRTATDPSGDPTPGRTATAPSAGPAPGRTVTDAPGGSAPAPQAPAPGPDATP
ncbi:hypothetical protein SAMN06272735_2170 [Streptomyces sp. TLI_55]|uniref:hypothetical protein n=1 Tax=Streptomyces sp. TLI_55 TaxID=1938861 RepID=UPI000BCD069A|nr:hypothetical protein [Streptomyces sp. TLI_55]SNX57697.1 hypothetical protein SAMN06272735_2170 [Streptomyces sp. TLI_55]